MYYLSINSLEGEISKKNYIKINNSKRSSDTADKMIKDKFGL